MNRSERLKKHGKSNKLSGDKYEEEGVETAARTRPFSLEEILHRRKNKELLEVKDSAKEAWNGSHGASSENVSDYFESGRVYKREKILSSIVEKHVLEEPEYSSRKKVESTSRKEYNSTDGKDRGAYDSETKLRADLSNMGWINKNSTSDGEMHGRRKNDGRVIDNSEYEAENKRIRDSTNRDKYLERDREISQRKVKKMYLIVDDESPGDYKKERNHNKDTYDHGKRRKWSSDNSENVVEQKRHLDISSKNKHADGRGKYGRKSKRKYDTVDEDKIQGESAARKQYMGKNRDPEDQVKKERQESVNSHYEESMAKRRWSGRREHDERTISPDLSPRAQRRTYNGEHKDLPAHSLKNSSRRLHSDADRGRAATNGSRSHYHRHSGSTSGLGGYSPRKRKTEAAVKTPSPSKHSLEKKRAGWDLPPGGADNSSAFQLSNITISSAVHDVASAAAVDPVIVKPPVSHLNDSSTGKNADIDSVQLTQATRPMRRLYLENLPSSASEKAVMESLNNLLLSAGVNLIQGAQPCISCILHKDKGQALVEFITADDASAALSFDGSTLFGSMIKIRRPKDFVEVTTGDFERSVDADVTSTISDIVNDSPDKIFIGGISKHLSSEMLMEIAGAFGSLKAYHFGAEDTNEHCAFLEYADHSVTLKACAGLNGLKLAGKVLTVVQAMPNASSLENGGKLPSYQIPNHAKPLLCKASEVLKIKDVFITEALSSLSDVEIEETLEDIRLECARFGTVRSINVVKHSSDKNEASKSKVREAVKDVGYYRTSQNCECDNNNPELSHSEKTAYLAAESAATSGVECDNVNDGGRGADVDKRADQFSETKLCQGEKVGSDATVEHVENKNIPDVTSLERNEHCITSKDQSEVLDTLAADDKCINVENKLIDNDTNVASSNPNASLGPELDGAKDVMSKEDLSDPNASLGTELGGANEVKSNEGDISDHVFEPGCVFVEFRRTEACCKAAHCLHGRFFDGRMVTVEYVALSLYKARFTK